MSSRNQVIAFFATAFAIMSCGGETDSGVMTSEVTGAFTIITDMPNAGSPVGASYTRVGGFTSAKPSCKAQKIGACDVDPCYTSALISSGDALVSAGNVSIGGAELNSDVLAPQADGSYATEVVDTQIPWKTGGESVSIQWAHTPGDATQPGGNFTLSTPPFVTLQSGSAFADAVASLVRTNDLTFAWTSASAPGTLDRVNVVVQSGSSELDCTFDASAETGVIPAAALQYLTPGPGKFDVHSKENASQKIVPAGGAMWTLQFNVDARARTSYGVAKGSITIE